MNGAYQQGWTASRTGTPGENDKSDDGSTSPRRCNADGSKHDEHVRCGDRGERLRREGRRQGNEIDYNTVYDGQGGYQQSWTASNGNSGENDKSDDGSTLTQTVNADGSSVKSTFDAATGANGYDVKDAQGNETDYTTVYDGQGGYQQSWTASNGNSGENDKSDDGSTLTQTVNADGSSTTYTHDASTDMYKVDTVNADGSSDGYTQNADGSYSTYTQDASGNRQADNFDATGQLTDSSHNHSIR